MRTYTISRYRELVERIERDCRRHPAVVRAVLDVVLIEGPGYYEGFADFGMQRRLGEYMPEYAVGSPSRPSLEVVWAALEYLCDLGVLKWVVWTEHGTGKKHERYKLKRSYSRLGRECRERWPVPHGAVLQ